jgi:hypothetical protein
MKVNMQYLEEQRLLEEKNAIENKAKEVKEKVKSTLTTKYLVGVGIGLGVLFATVWVVGKAWKKSQTA